MDEPLSNLDAKLRVEMRAYVSQLHTRLDKTILYLTHDQVEAMTMGDRVAVMRDGRLQQVETPRALYDHPASLFVAGFIGSPAMNLLRGLPASLLQAHPELAARAGEEVVVGIRPEALRPCEDESPAIEGPVALVESLGSDLLVHVEVDAPAVSAAATVAGADANGTIPGLATLTARLEPSVRVRAGDRIRLSVDPERLHFFDPRTELALT